MSNRDKDPLAVTICDQLSQAKANRSEHDQVAQLIAEYTIPRKASFYETDDKGYDRERRILDSTAPRALEMFASFLWSSNNNPTHKWFQWMPEDADHTNDIEGPQFQSVSHQQWADYCAGVMLRKLATGGIYEALHENYLDQGWHGTACLYIEESRRQKGDLRAHHYHMKDIYPEEGEDGKFDKVIRTFTLTPRQAIQRWSHAGQLKSVNKKGKDIFKPINFIHAVVPSDDMAVVQHIPDAMKPAKDFPYYSIWICADDKCTMHVGGYEEMPYIVNRWYRQGSELFGRSPAMTVLGDILMVNQVSDSFLRAVEKLVNPPLVVPDGGLISPVRLFDGGITITDGEVDIKTLLPPGSSRVEMADAVILKRQEAIREGFFVPLFISPESPVKTATQVMQEADERNRAAAPMNMRQQTELMDPMLNRAFGILRRSKVFRAPPEDLDTEGLRFRYISPIASSVKQLEALAVMRTFEGLAPWSQVDETVFDEFNMTRTAKLIHAGSGAPGSMLNTKAEKKQLQEAREQAAAEQNMRETLPDMLQAGAAVTKANKG